jgi:AcrR family transcriptional regulator
MALTSSTEKLGLRERKKQRTRKTIVDVGLRLFAERGYTETTLTDIAAAADIAPSTFFNYFPSKPDIVFGLIDAVIDSARERILQHRQEGESATEAVLGWVRYDLAAVERPYSAAIRLIPRVVASDAELTAANRSRMSLLEDVFATAYAADLGESPDGVHARVMATIAQRGIAEVWGAWYEQHGSDPEFDPTEALALKAEYLELALAVGLDVVAALPHPDRLDGARREPAESAERVAGRLSRWRR